METAEAVGLSKEDIKEKGAVFTPPELINEMLDEIDFDWENPNHEKTWLDPTCGSGNFLVELAKRGIQAKNLYGVDIDERNIEAARKRLKEICPKEDWHWIDRNIVQGDALTFNYERYWENDEDLIW